MFALKMKSARLVKGIRLKCLFLSLAFFVVLFSAAVLLIAAIMCAAYGTSPALDGVFPAVRGASAAVGRLILTVLVLLSAFLFLCAASLRFALKAVFCFAADKNQARPKSFVSAAAGVRYLRCRLRIAGGRIVLFLRLTAPFFIECAVVGVWFRFYGAERISALICGALLAVSLAAALLCFFVRSRGYDEGVYLMVLNPRLPPAEAVSSSLAQTEGRLTALAVYRLGMLPRRLLSLLLLPAPFVLPFIGVFETLTHEKIYGENRRPAKTSAVTFYINKRTKMELHESAADG